MRIYPPSIGQVEEALYKWAQHRTWVSILRSDRKIFDIVLIFEDGEPVFGEEPLRRNVFKKEWAPECLEVIEEGQRITIRLHPSGK